MTECDVCRHELEEREAHTFVDGDDRVIARYCSTCCPRCGAPMAAVMHAVP